MAQSQFKIPHTLILLFSIIILAWGATHILPQGTFEMVPSKVNESRMEIVPNSYQVVPQEEEVSLDWTTPFTILFKGFDHGKNVIFFIFIVGGMFAILRESGAVDALIGELIVALGDRPVWLVAGGMFVFAAGSSAIGMAEEYIPFVPVLIILCSSLGFDRVTAIGILCVGYGTGYGVAALNPFTVLIAQEVAGLEPTSGLWFRLAISVPFLLVAIHHVWKYAKRVKADPTTSLVYDIPSTIETPDKHPAITIRHGLVLFSLFATLAFMVFAIKIWGWYMIELGALFFGLAIIIALIGGVKPNAAAKAFCRGAEELTTTALLIAFAYSISIVLEDGQVIHTVINGIATPLASLPAHVAAVGMYLVQCVLNFFVPSGSGQAYVTMPIMTPVADLVGVSRQTAVLAFQFGDGFTNIVVPTNAVLIGILTMAGIPYDRWLRFVLPFILKAFVLGSIVLIFAVTIQL